MCGAELTTGQRADMTGQFLIRVLSVALLSLAGQFPQAASAAEDDLARSILEKADQIRFPREGFQVEITINSSSPGQAAADVRKYRVLSKGSENTIVQITEPVAERGQTML